jgi:hypothetical protein
MIPPPDPDRPLSFDPDLEDDPLALPALTPEDMVLIEKNQLANALTKVKNGGSLNKSELLIIDAARRRALTPASPSSENPPPDPLKSPEKSDYTLHSEEPLTRAQIAADYQITTRTVDRCNDIGARPDIQSPPPWHHPHQLAEWYRRHYRSDPRAPARSKPKEKLPDWILTALARHPAPSPLSTLSPQSSTLPSLPSPDPSPPGPLPDALATADDMLARIHRRYLLVKNDPSLAPPAERAYLDALEKVQQARERARKSGETETQLRLLVEDSIDRVHRQLPAHLAAELNATRREILQAATDPLTFSTWCLDFFAAVGQRLARTSFRPTDP